MRHVQKIRPEECQAGIGYATPGLQQKQRHVKWMRDADVEKKRETGREMRSYGVPTKRRRPFQCLVSSFSGRRTCTAHPAHGNANHLAVGLLRRFTSIKITPHRPNE